ncbi:MAG: DUF421 domain-containing protein [Candidatus Marsarchaeota archaeon]|nr:DUF421 domain-containing protein [Candidatus Marsarchaeota archaeon]
MELFVHDLPGQLVRVALMYFFALAVLRFAGKRRLARLSPMDLIIIIALGSAVGDVLIYPQNIVGIGNAMVAIAAVIFLQIAMSKLVEKNRRIAYILEGNPTLLIHNGRILRKNLDDEDISEDDLMEMLREQSISSASRVREAYLERSGELGVLLFSGQTRRIRRRIRRAGLPG